MDCVAIQIFCGDGDCAVQKCYGVDIVNTELVQTQHSHLAECSKLCCVKNTSTNFSFIVAVLFLWLKLYQGNLLARCGQVFFFFFFFLNRSKELPFNKINKVSDLIKEDKAIKFFGGVSWHISQLRFIFFPCIRRLVKCSFSFLSVQPVFLCFWEEMKWTAAFDWHLADSDVQPTSWKPLHHLKMIERIQVFKFIHALQIQDKYTVFASLAAFWSCLTVSIKVETLCFM